MDLSVRVENSRAAAASVFLGTGVVTVPMSVEMDRTNISVLAVSGSPRVHFDMLSWQNNGDNRQKAYEWLCERTEHLYIYLFFCPSLNGVLFPMFCLPVEGECQILVF